MSAVKPKGMTARRAREVLGVGPLASPSEIRAAFRDAAKTTHPDRPGGSDDAFREVSEAYRLLEAARPAAERIVQPPAPVRPATTGKAILPITPLTALSGGEVRHDLADGRRLKVSLPAGLRAGDKVRAGEVELEIVIRGDGETLVRGDDLWLTVKIDPRMLAEGGRLALDTPLGRRVVWITKKAGERGLVRLVGQGLPARGRHRQGHLFLRLAPHKGKADSAARTLLRRFAAAWAA